jgi:predicted glycoside hydrolase/deacetylase ChbG (UPF0249 family)
VSTTSLIVNADDFGLTPGVNAGILDAHLRGIVTSASLLSSASATDDAIRLARGTPTLGVGCHLALVDATPTLSAERLPTLAPLGSFRPTWAAFIRAALARRVAWDEVERELTAQIDRLRSDGVALTHLDGHKHVHAFPPVFAIVVRLARRFGIQAVRVPCEPDPVRGAVRHAFTARANRQAIENLALAPWAWRDRGILRREGLPAAPRFVGRVLTGLFTPRTFRALLKSLPPGVSELMVHPGYFDRALDLVNTRLREQRAAEVSLLTDPGAFETIRRRRIVLIDHLRTETRSHVA